jgi:hypothetical protein
MFSARYAPASNGDPTSSFARHQQKMPQARFKPFSTAQSAMKQKVAQSSWSTAVAVKSLSNEWSSLRITSQPLAILSDKSNSASQLPGTHSRCLARNHTATLCSATSHNRRHILLEAITLSAAISPFLQGLAQAAPGPSLSSVAPPGSGDLATRLARALPFQLPITNPEPVKFPRKGLDQRFAVLLMRSSYDAVNALDFIPMEKFEVSSVQSLASCV